MTMQYSLCGQVGCMSLFLCLVIAQVVMTTVCAYLGLPLLGTTRPSYTEKAGSRFTNAFFEVLHVGCLWDIAQVFKTVIRFDAVDVVNAMFRPAPRDHQPNEAMCKIPLAVQPQGDIPLVMREPNLSPNSTLVELGSRSKNARRWVVMKYLAQMLRCKIGLSHDALQLLIGQRPRRVGSTSRPRYFASALPLCVEASWP